MIFYSIMAGVIIVALGMIGFLFYLLNKEGSKKPDEAVPLTDIVQIKKEFAAMPLSDVAEPVFTAPMTTPAPQVPQMTAPEFQPEPEPQLDAQPFQVMDDEEKIAYKQRISDLEEELGQLSEKAIGQAQEALAMIDQLNKENKNLTADKQAKIEEYEARINEASSHLSDLRKDNDTLQVQLDNSEVKIRFLEDEVVAIKKQMGDEITRMNAQVMQMQKEQEPAAELTALQAQIQALKEENEALRQANVDVQRSTQKLKELNDHLIQKADFLQYELTKTRAQASGWERISGNYKIQLEKAGAASGAAAGNRLPLSVS